MKKYLLGLYVGNAEFSKYWLSILNELKNRGLKDIMILCADGLTGIKESISVAFPNTEYQRCIVHQVRNTLKYVSYKEKKEFAADLKSIYLSGNEEQARQNLDAVSEKWWLQEGWRWNQGPKVSYRRQGIKGYYRN